MRTASCIMAAVMLCTGCRGNAVPATSDNIKIEPSETFAQAAVLPESSAWTPEIPMPALRFKLRPPIREVTHFFLEDDCYKFDRQANRQASNTKSFATDIDAIAAAREWIMHCFEELPPESALEVKSVERTSNSDGYAVVFRQTFKGFPTDGGAVIAISGHDVVGASTYLYKFEPMPGTEQKVVPEKAAIRSVRDVYTLNKTSKTALAEFDKRARGRMCYSHTSVFSNVDFSGTTRVAVPTWEIEGQHLVKIDAYSGIPRGG